MKTQSNHSRKSESFDSTTAYKVANKVIWRFFSNVSSKYVKTFEIPDIVQDAVIRAFTYYYSFNPANGKFSGWVGMIAWRYAYDYLNKKKKEIGDVDFSNGDWEKVDSLTPETELINMEQEESIEAFRLSLSNVDRDCFEYMEDGLKPRDIAKEMSCSPGAAAARTCRLRKMVEEKFF